LALNAIRQTASVDALVKAQRSTLRIDIGQKFYKLKHSVQIFQVLDVCT